MLWAGWETLSISFEGEQITLTWTDYNISLLNKSINQLRIVSIIYLNLYNLRDK